MKATTVEDPNHDPNLHSEGIDVSETSMTSSTNVEDDLFEEGYKILRIQQLVESVHG